MADKYGSYYNNGSYNVFKAAIRYETIETTDTYVKIRCRSWCKMGDGHDSGANIQGQAYITNSYSSWVAGSGYLNAGDESGFLGDITKMIYRTEKAQTITCSGQVWGSTWNAYSPWVNATITVSALQSWSVTYNANGGSGAPASQTKYYGKTLTLSSSTPTRSGYTFQGWATSASGSVAYKAGASYTGNAALSLYAIWKANATAPTISRLVAYRSTSGTRDEESTTQVTFECTWSMDSGAASRSVQFKYKIDNGSETTKTVSSPAISGSTTQPYSVTFASASRMTVTAIVTDSTHNLTATRSVSIGPVFKPFHMANKGLAAAFFGVASATWSKILKIFGRLEIEGRNVNYVNGAQGNAGIRFYKVATGTSQWNPCAVVQTKGGGSWTFGNYDGEEFRFVYFTKANIDSSTNTAALNMALGTTKQSWHKAISAWTSIATTSGTTSKTFTDVSTSGYSELLIVCKYSSSATTYNSSVVVPVADLDTTERWWYLGGGWWDSGYGAACKLTKTKIVPDKIKVASGSVNANWTVYAR